MSLRSLKRERDKLPKHINAEGVRASVLIPVEQGIDWSGLGGVEGFAEAHFVSQRFIENGVATLRWVFEGSIYL
ncbi:hypothetical protein BZG05_14875 [Salinivibrio kushneri]|uniref:hypothetical protein n=1 Tax=Salinivibrio kushneri TaxID=1908198 RepID=UPI000988DA76|nr:hypothetical protein [Salinivibrio kushneri]OOE32286.1 hypothetical protein BZG05_14875 [Salinivibrio kushneri]